MARQISNEEYREAPGRERLMPQSDTCIIEGCDSPHYAKGLCLKHRTRERRHGDPTALLRRERGTGTINKGYVEIVVDGVRVREHRHVMAQAIGRELLPHETVHHINGDRQDNRLENLQLRSSAHGPGQQYVCLDCGSHNVKATEI